MYKLALQWQRFGPYHIARTSAAYAKLGSANIEVFGLETSSTDDTYQWREEKRASDFCRYTTFPSEGYGDIGKLRLWNGVQNQLNLLKPDAVAIAGYTTVDALSALFWCKRNGRYSVLMCVSKHDDAKRYKLKESVKSLIVRQFDAALCGGRLQTQYLISLGLAEDRAFIGYNAVNNQYFRNNSQIARNQPESFRNLPGLNDSTPFFLASCRFIVRKNLERLLIAYKRYRSLFCEHTNCEPWRLVILGDGPERENLLKIENEEEISGISWAGFRQIDELPAYYGLASCFIHPALQEQWGLVVNEAMASGLPVIVSERCGCAPELIIEGKTGFTFEPYNTEQLTHLLFHVSTDNGIDRVGNAARDHVENWGPERFAQGLLDAVSPTLLNE